MWEFSWLVRRQAPQDEYSNWNKVLDEALDRGYTCLRIDAFPHLVAEGDMNVTILPQPDFFMWGNNQKNVSVNPYRDLVTFMQLATSKGFVFGLSTWLVPDSLDRRGAVRVPSDLHRIWNATLHLLQKNDLLKQVIWVDLLNEFPVGQWSPGIWKTVFGVPWPEQNVGLQNALLGATLPLPWTRGIFERANQFLTDVIPTLKADFPSLNYTFSMQGNGISSANIQKLNTSAFDIAELHLWLSDDLRFFLQSGQTLMMSGPFPRNLEMVAPRSQRLYVQHRKTFTERLAKHIDYWHDWAAARKLPVYTTEAWGPVNYDDVPGDTEGAYWGWVKDIGEFGLRHALCRGWLGVTTSNFAEPHFPGMWSQAQWHRNQTATIAQFDMSANECLSNGSSYLV